MRKKKLWGLNLRYFPLSSVTIGFYCLFSSRIIVSVSNATSAKKNLMDPELQESCVFFR